MVILAEVLVVVVEVDVEDLDIEKDDLTEVEVVARKILNNDSQ